MKTEDLSNKTLDELREMKLHRLEALQGLKKAHFDSDQARQQQHLIQNLHSIDEHIHRLIELNSSEPSTTK